MDQREANTSECPAWGWKVTLIVAIYFSLGGLIMLLFGRVTL